MTKSLKEKCLTKLAEDESSILILNTSSDLSDMYDEFANECHINEDMLFAIVYVKFVSFFAFVEEIKNLSLK